MRSAQEPQSTLHPRPPGTMVPWARRACQRPSPLVACTTRADLRGMQSHASSPRYDSHASSVSAEAGHVAKLLMGLTGSHCDALSCRCAWHVRGRGGRANRASVCVCVLLLFACLCCLLVFFACLCLCVSVVCTYIHVCIYVYTHTYARTHARTHEYTYNASSASPLSCV